METGSFSFLTLSLILSRLSWYFQVLDRLISIHPHPLPLLEHARLSSLNGFTPSVFLTVLKLCKPFSCQLLCFLCPLNLCFSHLENPNHDSMQLFFPVHTHSLKALEEILLQVLKFSRLSIFRPTSWLKRTLLPTPTTSSTFAFARVLVH